MDECGVHAGQSNVFGCTAFHWLGLVPKSCLNNNGDDDNECQGILDLAKWLCQLPDVDVYAKQNQGHSVLHKAAWGGHLSLCQYFHEAHNMYDDSPDEAGNYAADLADMGGHVQVAQYLRAQCSAETVASCHALGVAPHQRNDPRVIKRAFHRAARQLHPDRTAVTTGDNENTTQARAADHWTVQEFVKLSQAYRHLIDEGGVGSQCNPKHKLPLLLTSSCSPSGPLQNNVDSDDGAVESFGICEDGETGRFSAQLTAVVLEYGNKGLDISNLRKKWRQLWPETTFPASKKGSLKLWLTKHANHVVSLRVDEKSGITRIYTKYPHQQQHGTASVSETDHTNKVMTS